MIQEYINAGVPIVGVVIVVVLMGRLMIGSNR